MNASGESLNKVIQMIAIGEKTSALDNMLVNAATDLEKLFAYVVNGLTSLPKPIVMPVLGVAIGGLIIAMYLPIFSMRDAVSSKHAIALSQDIS